MLEIADPLISINYADENLPLNLCNQVSLNNTFDSFTITAPVPPGSRVDTASENTCDCTTLLLVDPLELFFEFIWVSYLYYFRGTLHDSILVLAEFQV